MKVTIEQNASIEETRVGIVCKRIDSDVADLERHIRLFSKTIVAKDGASSLQVPASDVLYIESIDRRTFVYTEAGVLETAFALYELADRLSGDGFIRASKSMIVNLKKVAALSPEMNRTMMATMNNGEKVYISRQYARELKKLILRQADTNGRRK